MGWLRSLMGFEAPKPAPKQTAPTTNLPFGLGSGRMLQLDSSLALLLREHSELEVPTQEVVWAIGEVDLGQSTRLARFYMENEDYWLQVVMNGTAGEDVRDIILFGYYSAVEISSDAELKRLVGPESKIGLPYYEHEGKEFVRQWGSEEGQTELTPISEWVTNPEGSYRIKHLSMLYARDTGLTERREFLLISVEEGEEGSITLTTSIGVTLLSTDFRII